MSMGPQDAHEAYEAITGIIDGLPTGQREELFDLLYPRLLGAPGVAASVGVVPATEPAVGLSPFELLELRTRIDPEGHGTADDPNGTRCIRVPLLGIDESFTEERSIINIFGIDKAGKKKPVGSDLNFRRGNIQTVVGTVHDDTADKPFLLKTTKVTRYS